MKFGLPPRGYYVYAHDIVMAILSFYASLYLRLGDEFVFYISDKDLIRAGLLFAAIAAGVFLYMRLYRGVWRYASINDLLAITRAVTLVVLLFLLAMFLWTRLDNLPRSLLVVNWFVLMAMLGGPRFIYRLFKDRRFDRYDAAAGHARIPVLLAGAGDAAEEFIRSLARDTDANYHIVGIVSESKNRVGRNIHGVPVLGTTDTLAEIVARLARDAEKPQRLILTNEDMSGDRVRALLDATETSGMTLARLPRLTEFKSGLAEKNQVRPVAIEDLLGRAQKPLDRAAMATLIEGRRVLITGAGGSIGSELVRQISNFGPTELALLDSSEFNLYVIDLEVCNNHPDLPRRAIIADVRDRARIDRVFAEFKPELVFHAAALKHVPLVEINPFEGVSTNVVGTANVADAAARANALAMVMISTDKAVNPTNIMGATKRIAESYCQALDLKRGAGDATRFVTVRFGNVLGSTGSVVPLFQKQLENGGPLTVTDAGMTRYFMTVGEAVELVLQASALGVGEAGDGKIYVLDMGEPVKILDLAHQMIRLAGLVPDKDVKIQITGLRPGEKLFEEMFHGSEPLVKTGTDGILLAAPRTADANDMTRAVANLNHAAETADGDAVLKLVAELVPEYQPDSKT